MWRQFKTDFTKETCRQVVETKQNWWLRANMSIESYLLQKRLVIIMVALRSSTFLSQFRLREPPMRSCIEHLSFKLLRGRNCFGEKPSGKSPPPPTPPTPSPWDLNCCQTLYSKATDLKLGSSTYFFLLFPFLVFTKSQVLHLRVGWSRDPLLQKANFTIISERIASDILALGVRGNNIAPPTHQHQHIQALIDEEI